MILIETWREFSTCYQLFYQKSLCNCNGKSFSSIMYCQRFNNNLFVCLCVKYRVTLWLLSQMLWSLWAVVKTRRRLMLRSARKGRNTKLYANMKTNIFLVVILKYYLSYETGALLTHCQNDRELNMYFRISIMSAQTHPLAEGLDLCLIHSCADFLW